MNVGMGRREMWERKSERQGAGSAGLQVGEDINHETDSVPRTGKKNREEWENIALNE